MIRSLNIFPNRKNNQQPYKKTEKQPYLRNRKYRRATVGADLPSLAKLHLFSTHDVPWCYFLFAKSVFYIF